MANTITVLAASSCVKVLIRHEKINHSEAALWIKKYFSLFSKAALLLSLISKGTNTIMLSSRLIHKANQLGLHLDIQSLTNNTPFNRPPEEKYIILATSNPGTPFYRGVFFSH